MNEEEVPAVTCQMSSQLRTSIKETGQENEVKAKAKGQGVK